MKVSVLLATYEMPLHLELVLHALENQTEKNFEVLICDDGSGEKAKKIINQFSNQKKLIIQHFWQENLGFRKCKILNEAIRHSKGEILVFLDGDCIPHPEFIEGHWIAKQKGFYCAGRRINLGEKISSELLSKKLNPNFLYTLNLKTIFASFSKEIDHLNRTFILKNKILRKILKFEKIDDLLGSNFSVFKSDLLNINGFDEDYEGYGREDTDVEVRLKNLGLKIKSLKGLALQYHVWHPRRAFTPKNDFRLEELKNTKKTWCTNGIIKGENK